MVSNVKDMREAIHLLETGIHLLKDACGNSDQDRAAMNALSAAWRLADGTGLLRQALEFAGVDGCGISEPTGRGYTLPSKQF